MAHSLADIEDVALQLSEEDRAAEAERRFRELRDGVVQGIPARDVFAQLRAKLSL